MFLCETLNGQEKLEWLQKTLHFEGIVLVNSLGRSWGLTMLWKEEDQAKLNNYSQNHINFEAIVCGAYLWRLTGFYREPNRSNRINLGIYFVI